MSHAEEPRRRAVEPIQLIFAALMVASGAACYVLRGPEVFQGAALNALTIVLTVAPSVVAGLLVGSFVQQLISRDTVSELMRSSGTFRKLSMASAAGAITPGPFASFSIAYALRAAGMEAGMLISYLTAWSILGLVRILRWEIAFLGPDMAALRYICSIPLPFIAGIIAGWLAPYFVKGDDKSAVP
ncbi:MAG TPA: hypothetical protein VHG92_11235 [Afifellaceae bacterium]|nr:hypothetical protein [Afifellaceae bacterium]